MADITALAALKRKRKDLILELGESDVGSSRESALMKRVEQITEIIARVMRESGKLPTDPGANSAHAKKMGRKPTIIT